jgi:hypothetical protein
VEFSSVGSVVRRWIWGANGLRVEMLGSLGIVE